ncbi:MAG: hypothetical protein KatS3mg051_1568 [Anaerolineae bacterium]|nr:MAG: hypothetical protein KatS3mg051_1568 [Anaerolineae bacterium]
MATACGAVAPLGASGVHGQVLRIVGDSAGAIDMAERLDNNDTLTVVVRVDGTVAGYMIHRADSVLYRMNESGPVTLSRDVVQLILSEVADWVRIWESIRRFPTGYQ